jgi:hypothetical protein
MKAVVRSCAGRLIILCFSLAVGQGPLLGPPMPASAETGVPGLESGRWSGGAGMGFLGDTPDGILEFAFNGHADYFILDRLSIGPLAQYAGVGNDFLFGLSVQTKYWWDIPRLHATRLVVQGGIGFVRAGIKDTDTGTANTYGSFLVPIGLGIDHAIGDRLSVTADFFLNFTSLGETVRAGGREFDLHTNLMPAFYVGVRF